MLIRGWKKKEILFRGVFINDRLQVELMRRGFSGDLEKRTTVRYKDVIVGEYDGDMIVNGVVLVEIKIAPQYDKRDELNC